MKRSYFIFVLLFFIVIGYATLSTVLDLRSNIKVAENIEDFKIEITNLSINNNDSKSLISKDKHSFTFTGTSNDSISYTVTNYSYQYDANITLTCTPSENVTIEQINTLPAQDRITKSIISKRNDEITCTINIEKISRTDYAEELCEYDEGQVWTFDYTGNEQTYTVPCTGKYKLETWGAQGGRYSSYVGGVGAYSIGVIKLDKLSQMFINIGGAGRTGVLNSSPIKTDGGYNGGGSNSSSIYGYGSSGGGATHIAKTSGLLSTLSNKIYDILIVSGGGGGGGQETEYIGYCYGGHAGGIQGSIGSLNPNRGQGGIAVGNVGTQSSGAGFGYGGNGTSWSGSGGGGYYGGTAGCGGGGGSSYIGNPSLTNKAMYCYNCEESNEESTKTISTTCTSSTSTANCAKQGNGYAKITYLGK